MSGFPHFLNKSPKVIPPWDCISLQTRAEASFISSAYLQIGQSELSIRTEIRVVQRTTVINYSVRSAVRLRREQS